jgi:hypothetical protein
LGLLVHFDQPSETVKPTPVRAHEVHFAGTLSDVRL